MISVTKCKYSIPRIHTALLQYITLTLLHVYNHIDTKIATYVYIG